MTIQATIVEERKKKPSARIPYSSISRKLRVLMPKAKRHMNPKEDKTVAKRIFSTWYLAPNTTTRNTITIKMNNVKFEMIKYGALK
jgi:hypothetical protein